MTQRLKAYPGRVIFDHLAKTAGQAVNAWLREELGTGCVTFNLIGNHRELIARFGGNYSVISGHISFFGEGLDPRYQYVTCLRQPIDRTLSWLYFLQSNHDANELGDLWRFAQRFIESEGAEGDDSLLTDHFRNYYVEHFAAVGATTGSDDAAKLERALAAVESYDVWGFHEALPDFLADFATLLGLPAPGSIGKVNVTRTRPAVERVSHKFRKRLEELNALDLEFYRILRSRYSRARRQWQRPVIAVPNWPAFERAIERINETPEFALLSATVEGEADCIVGSVLSFVIEFSLSVNVAELEIGIHIFDADSRWAFGTNSTLLGQSVRNVAAGTYRERWAIAADLPEGEYTAGFAFAERLEQGTREIAWYDRLTSFRVMRRADEKSVGYVHLPAAIDYQRLSGGIVQAVLDAKGSVRCDAVLGDLTPGERLSIPVVVANDSAQDWMALHLHPINLSYRWLDESGNVVMRDSERTPLPDGLLRSGHSVMCPMVVRAPDRPGRYCLRILSVQEAVCWLDERGFAPLEIEVTVVAAEDARHYPARDVRLASQMGCFDAAGGRIGDGSSGYLLFGPYVKLPTGNWSAVLSGAFDCRVAPIRADVAAQQGARNFAQCEANGTCDSLRLDFAVEGPVDDLEVRLWVEAGAVARIDELRIEPRRVVALPPVHHVSKRKGKK